MPGDYPDYQRVANWIGAPLDTLAGAAVGVGGVTRGPFTITNFASVIIMIKPTTNACQVLLAWSNSLAPATLSVTESFTPAVGSVGQTTFNVLGDTLTITLTGQGGTSTVDYAVIPANTVVGSNFLSACIISEATSRTAQPVNSLLFEDQNGNVCQRINGNRTVLATGSELALESWAGTVGGTLARVTVTIRDSTGVAMVSKKLLAGDGTSDFALGGTGGAFGSFSPASPASIVNSASERHFGLGGTCKITPTNTGNVRVVATGIGAGSSSLYRIRHGTGVAPVNNALATGTADGPQVNYGSGDITLHWILTGLVVGSAYWLDVTGANNGSQTTSLTTPVVTASEF